jgi:GH25 family lysozyme M1 (1,4-beta-N-acetylmuramidase)
MATQGIDVSKWQGNINFDLVKASGIKFVMIRAGFGRYSYQKDEYFEQNYKRAKAAGLGVGAYWYSYATNAAQATEEAKVFCEVIKGKTFDYPVAFDIEDKTQSGLARGTIDQIVTAFCSYMEKAGYYVQLYSYVSFLNNKISASVRAKYDIWVAHFDVMTPAYNGPYGMWQNSSTYKVSGINGNVDHNFAYKNYPSIMKNNGLNGFTKSRTTKTNASSGSSKKPTATAATVKKPAATKKHTVYTVVKGDTLTAIAKKYNTTVAALVKANNIKNPDLIFGGQKIKIP